MNAKADSEEYLRVHNPQLFEKRQALYARERYVHFKPGTALLCECFNDLNWCCFWLEKR